MIVKSMSRKAPTFGQLAHYIDRDATGPVQIAHNLTYAGRDPDLIAAQFQQNYRHLPKRRNGNALYHLVLVLPAQPQLQRERLQPILQQLGQELCKRFAPDQIAWGRAHFNTDHPHIHLMISANDVRGTTRRRLSKQHFAELQRDMEAFKQKRFRELVGMNVYRNQSERSRPTVSSSEGELIRRTNSCSAKQKLRDQVYAVMRGTKNRDQLESALQSIGLELYRRGQSWGIINKKSSKRHRFSTLGLEPELCAILAAKKTAPSASNRPVSDARAASLLNSRKQLERAAREQLNEIDRGDER